ncbi:hypothetical protein CNMCM6805_002866 [Aspergillus fumigatiaffinis]|uniref:2-oxoadipate dioxygenase/decarboxylase n=1 Tax=Aspergillus fumigatiaffinis TaxID=340414 RepID=A0A8H4GSL6_9EURO|nr:hypothetical protein CNMCM6805_002866 [Aspergillus fumigatiaffinis]
MMAVSADDIRASFASALSEMYRQEVPQYGTLLEIVSEINTHSADQLRDGAEHRVEVERHGAIRLGTPAELRTMRQLFQIMGMDPVGYYDLSIAGLPVHACARHMLPAAVKEEPLAESIPQILCARQIFTPRCLELIEQWQQSHAFSLLEATEFITEALETFRWHRATTVDWGTYQAMQVVHPLIADIVCFRGPHINHLTPRVVDIEAAQVEMLKRGLQAKDHIEGPPRRQCPILLRQTSFLALEERVAFSDGAEADGKHRARFGEIEQRGMALTPKGRLLYDSLIQKSGQRAWPSSAPDIHQFPDDYAKIREEGLGYFTYHATNPSSMRAGRCGDLESLIQDGVVSFEPIPYEDFLPISAAGIFKSNLNGESTASADSRADKDSFETHLGVPVHDPFDLYQRMQEASITETFETLGSSIPS